MMTTAATDKATTMDSDWVLDAVVGFLRGPVWHVPLLAFVEKESVVFGDESDELDQETVERLFQEYGSLVDSLLTGQMTDLGVTEQQFQRACQEADGQLSSRVRRALFEQLWAAQDQRVFVTMMRRKNVELQLEALELLAAKYGVIYEAFAGSGVVLDDELKVKEAMRRSLEEDDGKELAELDPSAFAEEQLLLAKKIKDLEQDERDIVAGVEQKAGEKMDKRETDEQETDEQTSEQKKKQQQTEVKRLYESKTNKNLKKSQEKSEKQLKAEETFDKTEEQNKLDSEQASEPSSKPKIASELDQNIDESQPNLKLDPSVSESEIKARAEYLKQQRDRLLALKRNERAKQLVGVENAELNARRPNSAKAVRPDREEAGRNLAFRQALAERLRKEVIDSRETMGKKGGETEV